jgi:hypothetical protein
MATTPRPPDRQVTADVWVLDHVERVERRMLLEVHDGVYIGFLPTTFGQQQERPTFWFVPWDDVVSIT